jgi:hypothetical protein
MVALAALLVVLIAPIGASADEVAPAAPLFGLFERAKAAVVTVRAQDIEAMGVAVVDGSLVLTAEHVVTNTAWVEVQAGKQIRQAQVLYWDESVAVLGLESPLEYVAPLDVSTLETRVGQQVWTLTRAAERGLGRWALHESRVAAVGERKFEVDIQCSAGSLGAPVLDRQGRLAGVITEPERGEVVARRPEVLADVLQASAGQETGPPEGVGVAFDVAMQWHLPLPESSDDERETGIGFEGAILGGRHLMVPWSFRLAGTSGFWKPGSGEVNRSRFAFLVGLGGDFELTMSRKPYVPLVFQVYGLAGLGMFFERQYDHTVQLVDPECDPAVQACSALVTREELLQRELPFVFGGGVRVHIPGMVFGFEVNTTPSAPRDDLRLMFTVGLGGRQIRVKD